MPKQLAACKTVQEMYGVYADFFQTAVSDYQSEFEQMSKLGATSPTRPCRRCRRAPRKLSAMRARAEGGQTLRVRPRGVGSEGIGSSNAHPIPHSLTPHSYSLPTPPTSLARLAPSGCRQ